MSKDHSGPKTGHRSDSAGDPTIRDGGFRYVPVNQFTPLSNDGWQALSAIQRVAVSGDNPWRAQLIATTKSRSEPPTTSTGSPIESLWIEVISYERNICRFHFQPGWGDTPLPRKVFGPVTHENLETLRRSEQQRGAPGDDLFRSSADGLQWKTRDLTFIISPDLFLTVTRESDGLVIHRSAADANGNSLLATFVDPRQGNATAVAWVNNKESAAKERFYGQGEVNVLGGSQSVAEGGYYVLGKTGLAMTNFNYDQITYAHPELYPEYPPETMPEGVPNYYFPMYFSAPWLICVGNRGRTDQYAYGVYLDNPSQTYTNTGDELWGAGAGNRGVAYVGAQYGDSDLYFVFGEAGKNSQPVENVVQGLSYLTSHPSAAQTPCAAMPPKYVFGYFQGIYGAVGVTGAAFDAAVRKSGAEITVDNATTFEAVLQGYRQYNVPLEGFAVDVDVQNIYEVFTTNDRFWTEGSIRSGKSVFEWAHDNGLVTQTNITCFIRDDRSATYGVYRDMVAGKRYSENSGADDITFVTDGTTPGAYNGYLQYGEFARTTAIFPDWGRPGTPEWWGPNYRALFDLGLDFVWQDMTTPSMDTHILGSNVTCDTFDTDTLENANRNTPEQSAVTYAKTFNWRSYHPQLYLTDPRYGDGARRTFAEIRNLHAYSLCDATYRYGIRETPRRLFQRSYIIARGGQIGSQQFGGLWMGDNQSNWTDLNLMVPMVLSMNLSGVSVVGADIGGFAQDNSDFNSTENEGTPASPELLSRWIEAGCLLPWFRNHYDRWLSLDPSTNRSPAEWQPKKHGKPYQELYHYTAELSPGRTYIDAMIDAIALRYRWQEVLYTAAWLNASTGAPMMQSMILWEGDPNIDFDAKPGLNSQFLLGGPDGKQILAAPILTEGQTERDIYFPAGADWFRYNLYKRNPDGEIVNGDTDDIITEYQPGGVQRSVRAEVGNTPIFVRKGAVLPTRYPRGGANKSINTYDWSDPFVLDVFGVAHQTSGLVYIDDGGVTTSAETDGNFSTLLLEQTVSDNKSVNLTLSIGNASYAWEAVIFIRLRAVRLLNGVSHGNSSCPMSDAESREGFFRSCEAALSQPTYWPDKTTGSVWIAAPYGNTHDDITFTVGCTEAVDLSNE